MSVTSIDRSPYRQPKSAVGAFFWRHRVRFESTFAFTMCEPWEKIMLLTIFSLLTILVLTGLYKYLPHHLHMMLRRSTYYLWGQEEDERFIWQWLGSGWNRLGSTASRKEL